MVSPIPASPAVLAVATGQLPPPAAEACVDCALDGNALPLTITYTVNGTILCKAHAIAERESQKTGATQ